MAGLQFSSIALGSIAGPSNGFVQPHYSGARSPEGKWSSHGIRISDRSLEHTPRYPRMAKTQGISPGQRIIRDNELSPSAKQFTASGRKNREMWKLKVRNTVARLARAHCTLQSKPQKPDRRFPIFSTGGCRIQRISCGTAGDPAE